MNIFPNGKDSPWSSGIVSALLVMLVLFTGAKAWNAFTEHREIGQVPRGRDTITIQGEGKVSGKPTLAQIDIGLYSEGKDVPEVQNQNSQKVNAMVAAMKELSIAEADLQTSHYSISPRYEYKDGAQNVIGYTVSQNVSVKVRDLAKVGTVLSKVGQLGANQVNGVNFTIDDPTALKQEARKEALQDARDKAEELAKALGVKITRVVTFAESSGSGIPPMPYAYKSEMAVATAIAPDIQAGSLDVVSQVSVTYEVR